MRNKNKRYEWLIDMIKVNNFTCGAELGCARGNTTVKLLEAFSDLKLTCVDVWEFNQPEVFSKYSQNIYKEWDFKKIKAEFLNKVQKYGKRVFVIESSTDAATNEVEDGSLDFVFIDADHAYEPVKKDILNWAPKLRGHGVICGHDINLVSVQKAVDELIPEWRHSGIDNVWYARKEDVNVGS